MKGRDWLMWMLLGLTGSAGAEVIEKQAAADARGAVEIINVAGDVQVRGWDRAEVQIRGTLAGSDRLEFRSDDRRTLVQVVAGDGRKASGSADLIVHVPRMSTLGVNTVSADQRIEEVHGSQRLQTVSGEIETAVWGEELQAKTIDGDVRVLGHAQRTLTAINTVSGDISLTGIGGEIELQTVTGDMQVQAAELNRTRLRTTNGDVIWRASLSGDARFDAESVNGDLRVLLGNEPNARFDVETFNGDIDNCFGPQARRTREYAPGRALRFSTGEGRASIRIKTLNGGVEICRD